MISEYLNLPVEIADAAGTDKTRYVTPPAGTWELVGVNWTPSSTGAVTADGTDYRDLIVKKGSTALCTITTNSGATPAGTSWVAGTAVVGTLSTTNVPSANAFTGDSDPIVILSDSTGGTGKVANGHMMLRLKKVRV